MASSKLPTIADLPVFSDLEQLEMVRYDFSPYPHVQVWRERMRALPSYDEVHAPLHKVLPKIQARL